MRAGCQPHLCIGMSLVALGVCSEELRSEEDRLGHSLDLVGGLGVTVLAASPPVASAEVQPTCKYHSLYTAPDVSLAAGKSCRQSYTVEKCQWPFLLMCVLRLLPLQHIGGLEVGPSVPACMWTCPARRMRDSLASATTEVAAHGEVGCDAICLPARPARKLCICIPWKRIPETAMRAIDFWRLASVSQIFSNRLALIGHQCGAGHRGAAAAAICSINSGEF